MSSQKPRVSVGLPVYNGERFLEESLKSLLCQTYSDFELIVSDNASTDDTEAICRSYEARDKRIRYFRNSINIGVANNYNQVFKLSGGEYFKWAAADDLCMPNYIEHCINILEHDSTVVLTYAQSKFIDEAGNPVSVDDPGWNLRSEYASERLHYVIHAGHLVSAIYGLMRANSLAKTRLIGCYPGGDYRLLGELALLGKFFEIPHSLFLRRFHPNASSQNNTSIEWLVAFYAGRREHVCLPQFKRSLDHGITILKSQLNSRQKLDLMGSLLRSRWWQKELLLQELEVALKVYFRWFQKNFLP